jgi:hypothetical protein
MGRFYRTSSARPLDYMFEINAPLLERVVEANDQFIDQTMGGLSKLDQLANYEHLIGDEEDAQKITKQYRDQVEEVSQAILKNPTDWRKHLNPIRDISKKLQQDYESGTISKHLYNYNQRKAAFDAVDKQVELWHTSGGTKGVDPTRASAYKNHWDSKFDKTAYDPSKGTYNTYKGGSVMDNIDVKKVLADGLDKIKADKTFQYREDEAGNGWYFNKVTNKEERITPEKILQIASDNINQPLMQYLAQDSEVGAVSGVFDEQGRFIPPYTYSEVPLSSQEQNEINAHQRKIDAVKNPTVRKQLQEALDNNVAQLQARRSMQWNDKSYLAPILRGLVNTYSYSSVEQGNDLSNNSKGSVMYSQAQQNFRQGRQLDMQWQVHKDREAGLNNRLQKNLDFQIWKHLNPQDKKGTSSSTSNKTGAKKDEKLPIETGVSRLATNSFENWLSEDGKNPVLSIEGLSYDIDKKKKDLNDINTKLSDINKGLEFIAKNGETPNLNSAQLKLQKEQLLKRKNLAESELNLRRKYYEMSAQVALTNHESGGNVTLTPEQIELYKKYENDKEGNWYNKKLQEITSKIRDNKLTREDFDGKNYYRSASGKLIEVDGNLSPTDRDRIVKEFGELKPVTNPDELDTTVKNRLKATRDTKLKEELYKTEKEWDKYKKAREIVNTRRQEFLKTMRQDIIDTDAIQLGDKDRQEVADIILANTSGLKLFDAYGRPTDKSLEGKGISWFNPTGDNYRLSFADNSLKDYMDKYNVKMEVLKVGNTTNLGSGNAIAEVMFKDNTGGIDGKVHYLELTPEVQKRLGDKFKTAPNKDVASIASNMVDDEANSIRTQLMKPSSNRALGKQDKEEAVFTIQVSGPDGNKIPLNVTRFTDGTSNHLFITDSNGRPMPTRNGTEGFFNGIDDFIIQFREQRQAAIDQMNKK